jgi:hypothetical protein
MKPDESCVSVHDLIDLINKESDKVQTQTISIVLGHTARCEKCEKTITPKGREYMKKKLKF